MTTSRFTLTVVAFSGCVGTLAHAQTGGAGGVGRLEGTVTDSVHTRPLAAVQVVVVGTGPQTNVRATATSDSAGRFQFDSLTPGRYLIGFESPLLDSLEMELPPHEASVASGVVAKVDVALPPAAKLRAAVCPGVALPAGTGVIYGHVSSAETENPLGGVAIALSWRELGIDRKSLRPVNQEGSASVTTDSRGWYRVCGVPTGTWVSMQLQNQGHVGPVIRAMVNDTLGIAIRHLSFSAAESRAEVTSGAARADKADAAALSGTASLSGTVLGTGDAPVPAAEVRVRGTAATTRTDATGRYALAQLPAGTQVLEVRRVGYEVSETPVELRSGVTTRHDLRLQRVIVALDSMRAVATRSKYPEFQERREHALGGIFLGPEDMARQHVVFTSDVIEKVPGFRIVGVGPKARVVSSRGGSQSCFAAKVNVVVDGMSNQSINDVHPSDVDAIEAYRLGDPAPAEYDRGCGVIVIWTKR